MGKRQRVNYIADSLTSDKDEDKDIKALKLMSDKDEDIEILKGILLNEDVEYVVQIAKVLREHKKDIARLTPAKKNDLVARIKNTIEETRRPANLAVNIEMRCFGESASFHVVGRAPETEVRSDTQYDGKFNAAEYHDGPAHQEY